jgi:hypothetical protein
MSLILSGTDGLSDVDGSASTPAIRGTDTNTGIFFPATDTIAFAEGGAEVARFDSSGNLGIGSTSPASKLEIKGTSPVLTINQTDTSTTCRLAFYGYNRNYETTAINTTEGSSAGAGNLTFWTNSGGSGNSTERMRINSLGRVLLNTTTSTGQALKVVGFASNGAVGVQVGGNGEGGIDFYNQSAGYVASIVVNSSSVAYNTTSDYRLKENIAPMTGALAKVSALKPVTYTWKSTGEASQGFIAHELAEVVPDCVTGEKDAVETYTDEDGVEQTRPKYQGIDTSFLVATLTAAIQEQQAIITDLKSRIEALEA